MLVKSVLATTAILSLASAKTLPHGGGATWCTFNDDCLGYSDKKITKDCCAAVKGQKTHYDEVHHVCVSRGGPLYGDVDMAGMYDCCVTERRAQRMCACDTQALIVSTKPRLPSQQEILHFNLTDRNHKDSWEHRPVPAKIPFGSPFMNTIHDAHYPERQNGARIRVPKGTRKHLDYQCEKTDEFGQDVGHFTAPISQ